MSKLLLSEAMQNFEIEGPIQEWLQPVFSPKVTERGEFKLRLALLLADTDKKILESVQSCFYEALPETSSAEELFQLMRKMLQEGLSYIADEFIRVNGIKRFAHHV